MFDPALTPKRRGFAGRPLAALTFAVAVGVAATYAGSRLHVGDPVLSLIVVGTITVVAGAWHWLDF